MECAVVQRLAERWSECAENVAVSDSMTAISFAELMRRVECCGRHFSSLGCTNGDRVICYQEPDVNSVVLLLACLARGFVYTPIDAGQNSDYVIARARDVSATLLVTNQSLAGSSVPGLQCTSVTSALLARQEKQIADWNPPTSDAPAYIMFTSGTTGKPKAVVATHGNVLALLDSVCTPWSVEPNEYIIQNVSWGFDPSIWLALWTIQSGARLHVISRDAARNPELFADLASQLKAKTLNASPSLIQMMIEAEVLGHLSAVRTLFTGGEQLQPRLIEVLRRHIPNITVVNVYGPTECTVHTSMHVINPGDNVAAGIPIGLPVPGAYVRAVDEHGVECESNQVGELIIGGDLVCRGYFGSDIESKFSIRGEPAYRSGDLGFKDERGVLWFAGRKDRVQKVNGVRVNCHDMELAISKVAGVKECAVVVLPNKHLAALVACERNSLDLSLIRSELLRGFPAAVVPAQIELVEALPKNLSGKTDVPAVLKYVESKTEGRLSGSIRDGLEYLWDKAVGSSNNSRDVGLIEAGCSSKGIVQLRNDLRQVHGVNLSISDLFRVSSFSAFVQLVSSASERGATSWIRKASRSSQDEAVAIIGMSARCPKARDYGEFWSLIKSGGAAVERLSIEELRARGVDDQLASNPHYVPVVTTVPDSDRFDATFFGYSPVEAKIMDPQHRVLLEEALNALEDAGYPHEKPGQRCGVYIGTTPSEYFTSRVLQAPEVTAILGEMLVGVHNNPDYPATKIAFKLNLTGPAVNIYTACSTSLVTVHHAAAAILRGECDYALAGGATIEMPETAGYLHQEGHVLSSDGECRPFDSRASGTVIGGGVGLVVVKRLSQAVSDGDRILAVIRGSAIGNDGGSKSGFQAPSAEGQARTICDALQRAGWSGASVDYVECHGTGTPLGDPIEIDGLTSALVQTGGKFVVPLVVGSVKANIGHANAAAGVLGLIKTVLALYHRWLPALRNFATCNPEIRNNGLEIDFPLVGRAWPRRLDSPRRAGISSFGLGGTNAHVAIEEWENSNSDSSSLAAAGCGIVPISAPTAAALRQRMKSVRDLLRDTDESVEDMIVRLSRYSAAYPFRKSFLFKGDRSGLIRQIEEVLHEGQNSRFGPVVMDKSGGGLLFGGFARDPGLPSDEVFNELDPAQQSRQEIFDWARNYFQEAKYSSRNSSDAIELLSPTLLAVRIFIHQLLRARRLVMLGYKPEFLMGVSLGEYTAAAIAGVIKVPDVLTLLAERSRLIAQLSNRGMSAQVTVRADLSSLLAELNLTEAVRYGQSDFVVSGAEESVRRLAASSDPRIQKCVVLDIPYAAHSAVLDPVVGLYHEVCKRVTYSEPLVPIVSTITGRICTDLAMSTPGYWSQQLRAAVCVDRAFETVRSLNPRCVVDLGPSQSMAKRAISSLSNTCCVPLYRAGVEPEDFRQSIASLWESASIPAIRVDQSSPPKSGLRPNTFPFSRELHWLELKEKDNTAAPRGKEASLTTRLSLSEWISAPRWYRHKRPFQGALSEYKAINLSSGDFSSSLKESLGDVNRPDCLGLVIDCRSDGSEEICQRNWLKLAQSLKECSGLLRRPGKIKLAVITHPTIPITGEETLVPAMALFDGLVSSIPHEYAGIAAVRVDTDGDLPSATLRGILNDASEFRTEPVLAYRKGDRYRRVFECLPSRSFHAPREVQSGVRIVVGGSGGIGSVLADALAQDGSKVISISRSGGRSQSAASENVEFYGADVTSLTQLESVFSAIRAKHGRIAEVYHSAGTSGDGAAIEFKSNSSIEQCFAVKVLGSKNVIATARVHGASRVVLFSSLATWFGRGGISEYVSANSYQNAIALSEEQSSMVVQAVCWDTWAEVGMATRFGDRVDQLQWNELLRKDAITNQEGVECFQNCLSSDERLLVVSRYPLSLVTERQWRVSRHDHGESQEIESAVDMPTSVSNPVETVRTLWQRLLGVDRVDDDSNFFSDGGDSILAIQLSASLNVLPGVRVSPAILFEYPTFKLLAERIRHIVMRSESCFDQAERSFEGEI